MIKARGNEIPANEDAQHKACGYRKRQRTDARADRLVAAPSMGARTRPLGKHPVPRGYPLIGNPLSAKYAFTCLTEYVP